MVVALCVAMPLYDDCVHSGGAIGVTIAVVLAFGIRNSGLFVALGRGRRHTGSDQACPFASR